MLDVGYLSNCDSKQCNAKSRSRTGIAARELELPPRLTTLLWRLHSWLWTEGIPQLPCPFEFYLGPLCTLWAGTSSVALETKHRSIDKGSQNFSRISAFPPGIIWFIARVRCPSSDFDLSEIKAIAGNLGRCRSQPYCILSLENPAASQMLFSAVRKTLFLSFGRQMQLSDTAKLWNRSKLIQTLWLYLRQTLTPGHFRPS